MTDAHSQKVRLRLRDNHGREEFLSVTPLGEDLYRLEESPAFAYSISLHDVVRAIASSEGGLDFAGVAERSGNRTMRVMFSRFSINSKQARPILKRLKRLGCRYESSQANVLSVTLPPAVILDEVAEYLRSLGLWWEHADPTFEDLYGSDMLTE